MNAKRPAEALLDQGNRLTNRQIAEIGEAFTRYTNALENFEWLAQNDDLKKDNTPEFLAYYAAIQGAPNHVRALFGEAPAK